MDTAANQGLYRLRSGVYVLPEQMAAFERLTTELLAQIPANFVLLADVAGQTILARGNHDSVNLVMLGSLVAGDLAASQEIARLTGQYQDYQVVLREGDNFNTFIIEAGHHLALLVQVDREVPLGWARMIIKRTGQHLAEVMTTKPDSEPNIAVFSLADDDEESIALPDLFSEALDDLWVEL